MTSFHNLGKHCDATGCALKDFLPFQCDACKKIFCLEHRVYESHRCPIGRSSKDVRVIICPICDKSIKIRQHEDVNITWSRHERSECSQPISGKKQKSKVSL